MAVVVLAVVLSTLIATTITVNLLRRALMAQSDDLRAAIAQVGVDLGEALDRVEAKIASLGEPDADLSNEIASLRQFSTQLDNMAVDAPPAPGTTPADPAPPGMDPADPGDGVNVAPPAEPAPPVEPVPPADDGSPAPPTP